MKKIKLLLFILSVILISVFLNNLFVPKRIAQPWDVTRKIKGFYSEPKNSLDVVFIGSSHMFMGVSPMEIWSKYGIPSYAFGANEQPFWISYHYIKEVLKTQNPKIIVLDILYAHRYNKYERDGVNSSNLIDLKFSKNKIDAIEISVPENQRKKYYIPFYAFHDRWKTLNKNDFKVLFNDEKNFLKGYTIGTGNHKMKPLIRVNTNEISNRPEKIEMYLKKIIELTKKNEIELILIKTPDPAAVTNITIQKSYNRVKEIAEKNGIRYINLNEEENLKKSKIDFVNDMNDSSHLNYNGAQKVSLYLGEIFNNEYGLTSKKNNLMYKEWNEQEEKYYSEIAKFKFKSENNLKQYLEQVKLIEDVTVILSMKDEGSNQYVKVNPILKLFNLEVDLKNKYRFSYVGVVNSNGNKYFERLEDKKIEKKINIDRNKIEVVSAGYKTGNISSIKINDKEYSKNKRGLNIVIYDSKNNKVLDSVNIDTHIDMDLKITR